MNQEKFKISATMQDMTIRFKRIEDSKNKKIKSLSKNLSGLQLKNREQQNIIEQLNEQVGILSDKPSIPGKSDSQPLVRWKS